MLKSEMRTFQACIYTFTGPTFIGPDNAWALWKALGQQPGLVIAFHPLQRVDPRGFFAYVSDGKDIYAVSKDHLKAVKIVTIQWERKPFMTAYQEKAAEIEAMNKHFNTTQIALVNEKAN